MTDKGVNIQHIQEVYTIEYQKERKKSKQKIAENLNNFFFSKKTYVWLRDT